MFICIQDQKVNWRWQRLDNLLYLRRMFYKWLRKFVLFKKLKKNGVWITISYKYVDNLDTIDFLLMSEIARRKCYDPQLNQYDEFYQLPIAYCIVMGRILINKGYLAANGFLSNPNLTVFSTKDRVKNAKKLLQIFLDKNILSLGELNVIVDDFYQI